MQSPFCLADFERIRQISLIREVKQPFDATTPVDVDGLLFAECSFSEIITFSKEGRIACGQIFGLPIHMKTIEEFKRKNSKRSDQTRAKELRRLVDSSSFGLLWERLFWVIYEAIINARESNVTIPLLYLRSLIWDGDPPKHWRTSLRVLGRSLSKIQIWDQAKRVAEAHIFLNVWVDRVGKPLRCRRSCRWRDQEEHEHLHVSAGPAALGILEELFENNGDGTRSFPVEADEDRETINHRWNEQLSVIGKTGRLTQIYLPAVLGKTAQVRKLKSSGHRLLQVIIREATRPSQSLRRQSHWSGLPLAEIRGRKVPDHRAMVKGVPKEMLDCPFLDAKKLYVGFNGNGYRPGQGYRLATWQEKARYSLLRDFLAELRRVAELLGLIVVAFNPKRCEWKGAVEIEAIAKSYPNVAADYYLRVYALTDFRLQWDRFFGWDSKTFAVPPDEIRANIEGLMARHGLNKSQTAKLLNLDRSHFSKLLSGKRKLKPELQTRLQEVLSADKAAETQTSVSNVSPIEAECVTSHVVDAAMFHDAILSASKTQDVLTIAHKYRSCGWSIVPQASGEKKPKVKWGPYQKKLATVSEVNNWWQKFPQAGIALITGPLSGVFIIDVDGVAAHEELIKHLGGTPDAPQVHSGSGDPYRYHLYFQHPDFETKAKATPWHRELEFRGNKGLLILPPSIHKSGNQYQWTEASREWTGPLPDLPLAIVEALKDGKNHREVRGQEIQQRSDLPESTTRVALPDDFDCAPKTKCFLQGDFAEGPRWNDKLFQAACDLFARGVKFKVAVKMLEQGARPWDPENHQMMMATIDSAFSKLRDPS